MNNPILADNASTALSNVWKSFGVKNPAVRAVDFEVRAGEIHALVGENGAGKSTLMGVLSGTVIPDRGVLSIDGRTIPLKEWTSRKARREGIAMVYQQSNLISRFTVAQNLSFSQGPLWFRPRKAVLRVEALVDRFGLNVDGKATVDSLSIGERQRVELLRAFDRGARVLILDEPTSSLSPEEVRKLFVTMKHLCDEGCGVVFISHKFEEIREIADRVTVLRRGLKISTVEAKNVDADILGGMMLGKKRSVFGENLPVTRPNKPALAFRDVSTGGYREQSRLKSWNLVVSSGEIVGIAGISGNGQLELEELLAGVRVLAGGELEASGRLVNPSIRTLRKLGFSQLSGNRNLAGLIPGMSIVENMVAKGSYDDQRFFGRWQLDRNAAKAWTREAIEDFNIQPPDPDLDVSLLSGGNAQKVGAARELRGAKSGLIAFDPTRGLDLESVTLVHQQLLAARDRNCSVLLISSDLDELTTLADRLFVLVEGALHPVPVGSDLALIGKMMLGEAVW